MQASDRASYQIVSVALENQHLAGIQNTFDKARWWASLDFLRFSGFWGWFGPQCSFAVPYLDEHLPVIWVLGENGKKLPIIIKLKSVETFSGVSALPIPRG
jgi:hypothetical protein